MVVIRLSRGGSKNRPFYNIVVADSRRPRDGKFVERIGFYNPKASPNEEGLRVALDRLEHWKSNGAQPSDTVIRLAKKFRALPAVSAAAGAAPASATPAAATPAGVAPAGAAPAGAAPVAANPAGATPAGATPAGATPAGDAPAGDAPASDAPASDAAPAASA